MRFVFCIGVFVLAGCYFCILHWYFCICNLLICIFVFDLHLRYIGVWLQMCWDFTKPLQRTFWWGFYSYYILYICFCTHGILECDCIFADIVPSLGCNFLMGWRQCIVGWMLQSSNNIFRSARTSCTTYDQPIRPQWKSGSPTYIQAHASWITRRHIKPTRWPHGIPKMPPFDPLGPCRPTLWPLGALIISRTYLGQFGLVFEFGKRNDPSCKV